MKDVKEVIFKDNPEEGKFRSVKLGEKNVKVMVLVNAPDGVYYSVAGDEPGRYFLPMHMISSIQMADEKS